MIHHAFVISAFSESDSMLPQEITSSGRPIPIKLSVDSATIALRIFITTINIIDEKKFGADGAIIRNLSILKRKYYFILRNVLAAALV